MNNPTFGGNAVVLGSLSAYSGLDTGGGLTVAGDVTATGQLSANGGRLRTVSGANTLIRGLTVNGSSDADPIVLAPAGDGTIKLNRNLGALGNIVGGGDITVAGSATVGQLSANGGRLRTVSGANTLIRGLTVNGSSDADPIVLAPAGDGTIKLNRNLGPWATSPRAATYLPTATRL
jgi:pectate lyase